MRLRDGLFLVLGMLLTGCAGFSYTYYGLKDVDYTRGTLLAKDPNDDLAFSKCAPNASSKHPCIVMFAPEYFKMETDLKDTRQKLKDCQKGKPLEVESKSPPS